MLAGFNHVLEFAEFEQRHRPDTGVDGDRALVGEGSPLHIADPSGVFELTHRLFVFTEKPVEQTVFVRSVGERRDDDVDLAGFVIRFVNPGQRFDGSIILDASIPDRILSGYPPLSGFGLYQ